MTTVPALRASAWVTASVRSSAALSWLGSTVWLAIGSTTMDGPIRRSGIGWPERQPGSDSITTTVATAIAKAASGRQRAIRAWGGRSCGMAVSDTGGTGASADGTGAD